MKNFFHISIKYYLFFFVFSLLFGATVFLRPQRAHAVLINAIGLIGTSYTGDDVGSDYGLSGPYANALDTVNHRLFVGNVDTSGISVYWLDSKNNIASTTPAYVLGAGTSSFYGLAYDALTQRLFSVDRTNSRVLVFNVATSTITTGESPENVLGQPNFASNTPTTTQAGMRGPIGATLDPQNQRLFISDDINNRVLVFNVATSTITNGEPAENVLGQPDFTSNTPTTTQSGMYQPYGSGYDSTTGRLFVFDITNNRIMVFDASTSTITNGEPAENVLGQPDFTSNDPGAGQSGIYNGDMTYVVTSTQQLIYNDCGNNRMLFFNVATSTITNGEPAENVLMQPDFNSVDGEVTQSRMICPQAFSYDPTAGNLFVSDYTDRLMEFPIGTANISFSTSSLAYTAAPGALMTNEGTQSAILANINTINTTTLNWSAASSESWLTLNQASGSLISGATTTIDFMVDPSSLSSGIYNATATITDPNAGNSPQTMSISLTISSGTISFSSSSLDYTAIDGASLTDQGTQYITLQNTGGGTLHWSASSSESWLTFTDSSGVIGSASSADIGFMVDPSSLSSGIYNATATIADPSAANSPQMVSVSLTISPGTIPYSANGILGQTTINGNPIWTMSNSNNNSSTVNPSGFYVPYDVALDDINHRLFVGDANNNRVLVFPLDSKNNITTTIPEAVIGQTDFVSGGNATTQNGLTTSDGLALSYDPVSQRLFVGETDNNRVTVFDVSTSTLALNPTGENAEAVIGQTDFVSGGSATTQSGLSTDDGIALTYDPVSQRLFVGEIDNNRVTVFDVSTSTLALNPTGENAEAVIGQTDFVSAGGATTQNGMTGPDGLAYSPLTQSLFVADDGNNRVTVFDVSTSTLALNPTGENAEAVIGQTDFVSGGNATTQNGMTNPGGLAYSPLTQSLFVADTGNNRITVFDVSTSTLALNPTGENAEAVIGQTDFVSGGNATTQNGMTEPKGLAYSPLTQSLFVADTGNNRVIEYSLITIETPSLPGGTVGAAYSQIINTTSSQGTVNFLVSSGSLPPGLSLATSTGAISGIPTTSGTYTFTIEADDTFSYATIPTQESYTVTITDASTPSTPPTVVNVGGGGGGSYYNPPTTTTSTSTTTITTTTSTSLNISSSASLMEELQALEAELAALEARAGQAGQSGGSSNIIFPRNLALWSIGNDVHQLQLYLIAKNVGPAAVKLARHGTTLTFGTLTLAALVEFQKSVGIKPSSGYFGPITRAWVNAHN